MIVFFKMDKMCIINLYEGNVFVNYSITFGNKQILKVFFIYLCESFRWHFYCQSNGGVVDAVGDISASRSH